jgi:hypothetical protein
MCVCVCVLEAPLVCILNSRGALQNVAVCVCVAEAPCCISIAETLQMCVCVCVWHGAMLLILSRGLQMCVCVCVCGKRGMCCLLLNSRGGPSD